METAAWLIVFAKEKIVMLPVRPPPGAPWLPAEDRFRSLFDRRWTQLLGTSGPAPTEESLVALMQDVKGFLADDAATMTMFFDSNRKSILEMLNDPPPGISDGNWKDHYDRRVQQQGVVLQGMLHYLDSRSDMWGGEHFTIQYALSTLAKPNSAPKPVPSPSSSSVGLTDYYRAGAKFPLSNPSGRVSDTSLAEDLLEGMAPVLLTGGSSLTLEHDWSRFTRGGAATIVLPCIRVRLQAQARKHVFEWIDVACTHGGDSRKADELEWTRYTPSSGQDWLYAKHCARSSNILHGQLFGHFGRCHVLSQCYRSGIEELSAAHPVRRLLTPFTRMCGEINELGRPLVYGEGGVLTETSALGETGVQDVLKFVVKEGWWDWSPACDRSDARDGYSGAAVAFTRISRGFVRDKLRDMSTGDVEAMRAFDEGFSDARRKFGVTNHEPISSREDAERMAEHVIFLTSFLHTWTNDRQWQMGGDPAIASFGILRAAPPNGAETYEGWREEAVPRVPHGWMQVLLADILTHTPYGRVANLSSWVDPDGWTDDRALHMEFVKLLEPSKDILLGLSPEMPTRPLDALRPFVAI